MPSRYIEPYPQSPTFVQREYMLIDDGNQPTYVHLSVIEQMFNDLYADGCFDRNEHIYIMRALFEFNQSGYISMQPFRLPSGMYHPFWRREAEAGRRVLFHVLVEACYQEVHIPPPVRLFGEDIPNGEEMHRDLVEVLREFIEESADFDFTAPSA